MAFDELAVDTRHVHLPQVHPGPLPLINPADSAEHLLPHLRQLESFHGVAAHPGNQPGAAFPGGFGQLGEPAHLGQHAEQPPRLVVAVDPGPARDEVRSDVPAADLLVLDPQFTQPGPFPLPRPVLDFAEAVADLARTGPRSGKPSGSQSAPSANAVSNAPDCHFLRSAARTSSGRVQATGGTASSRPPRARAR